MYLVERDGILLEDAGRDDGHLVTHEASAGPGRTREETCTQKVPTCIHGAASKHVLV